MASDRVTRFFNEATRRLVQQGWRTVDETPDPFAMILTREKSTLVVQARTALFFINAGSLSQEDMGQAMKRAHVMTGAAARTPLFPATAVVVFVFSDAVTPDAVPEKQRDLAGSRATVAWTINLTRGQLDVHHGTPMVRDGKRELEQALHALSGT